MATNNSRTELLTAWHIPRISREYGQLTSGPHRRKRIMSPIPPSPTKGPWTVRVHRADKESTFNVLAIVACADPKSRNRTAVSRCDYSFGGRGGEPEDSATLRPPSFQPTFEHIWSEAPYFPIVKLGSMWGIVNQNLDHVSEARTVTTFRCCRLYESIFKHAEPDSSDLIGN
jgi:hypothetical protein